MKLKQESLKMMCRAGVIAALYAAICLLLRPLSYGEVQLRVSEALTLLPVLTPAAAPGLFIGCLLANLLGGANVLDIVFGSLTTLAAALLTRRWKNRPALAALPPVVLNGVVVGILMRYAYGVEMPLWMCMGSVALGQAVACYGLGLLLLAALRKVPERYL